MTTKLPSKKYSLKVDAYFLEHEEVKNPYTLSKKLNIPRNELNIVLEDFIDKGWLERNGKEILITDKFRQRKDYTDHWLRDRVLEITDKALPELNRAGRISDVEAFEKLQPLILELSKDPKYRSKKAKSLLKQALEFED